MRDIPIIFSAPMVRALLDGRKTQTRRLVPQPPAECGINYMLGEESWLPVEKRTPVRRAFEAWTGPLFQNRPAGHLCGSFDIRPRFQPRDRLWVRENFATSDAYAGPGILGVEYAADGATLAYANGELHHKEHGCAQYTGPWKPSIHMPRWASRLTLVVEQVRVERLQDITRKDVYAEGAITDEWLQWREDAVNIGMPEGSSIEDERDVFARLWTSLHGADAWAANPWVVALTFRVIRSNIDAIPSQEAA